MASKIETKKLLLPQKMTFNFLVWLNVLFFANKF